MNTNEINLPVKDRLNLFLFILIIILAIAQVVILNHNTNAGEMLSKLEQEIKIIEDENNRISQKIASASAIVTLSVKANALGLTSLQKTFSLSSPIPIAFSNNHAF